MDYIKRKITSIDIFSKETSLMHNGELRFKTFIGGVFSIITITLLLIYLILLTVYPIKLVSLHQNQQVVSVQSSNITNEPTTTDIIEINFTKTLVTDLIYRHNLRLDSSDLIYLNSSWIFGVKFLKNNYNPNFIKFTMYLYQIEGVDLNISLSMSA